MGRLGVQPKMIIIRPAKGAELPWPESVAVAIELDHEKGS
jgi:hypothetical protein